jgi:hypothetical protein
MKAALHSDHHALRQHKCRRRFFELCETHHCKLLFEKDGLHVKHHGKRIMKSKITYQWTDWQHMVSVLLYETRKVKQNEND